MLGLTLKGSLVLQGFFGQILSTRLQGVSCLRVQLVQVHLQLGLLHLHPLLGGGYLSHAPLDILQQFELLFIGQVQGLTGIFHPAHDLFHLCLHHCAHAI